MRRVLRFLYQPYKWIIYIPCLALSTLFFGSLAVALAFIVNPKIISFASGVTWSRLNAYMTPMYVKVIGRDNIDKKQSYVIVSNHQSQFDIFVLYGWLGVDFKWVMKQELRKVPALGIACEKMGHIFIDRSNPGSAIASINAAKNKIVNGTSVIFFSEGTRSNDGRLGDFKKGAFKMAFNLGLPILPITINGTKDILPSNTMDLMPGKAKMIIHKPIEVDEYDEENIANLMDKTKTTIRSGLEVRI
ncbi:MAG: 1-acyl-sn-glycerol-3-phosphate acyltransferase [Proteobacteria bacterium]|nr:1-acyl-sn-glycerol-3-phosphate acyltransferase [Pseudomonadota bacterium]